MERRGGELQVIGCIELLFWRRLAPIALFLIGDCEEAGMSGCEVYRMMAFDRVGSLDF